MSFMFHIGPHVSADVLFNFEYELRKREKKATCMLSILSLFRNEFENNNKKKQQQ